MSPPWPCSQRPQADGRPHAGHLIEHPRVQQPAGQLGRERPHAAGQRSRPAPASPRSPRHRTADPAGSRRRRRRQTPDGRPPARRRPARSRRESPSWTADSAGAPPARSPRADRSAAADRCRKRRRRVRDQGGVQPSLAAIEFERRPPGMAHPSWGTWFCTMKNRVSSPQVTDSSGSNNRTDDRPRARIISGTFWTHSGVRQCRDRCSAFNERPDISRPSGELRRICPLLCSPHRRIPDAT